VIQSGRDPNHWKVADFGISSYGTSKKPLATKYGRGTEMYCAPEILLSEPSIPGYTNKVDVWALGLVLYELFSGVAGFNNGFEAVQYYWGNKPTPSISIWSAAPGFTIATRLQSSGAWGSTVDEASRSELLPLWIAFSSLEHINQALLKEGDDTRSEMSEVNRLIAAMLERNPKERPSVRQLVLHFGANAIRSRIQADEVWTFT
jgi:serine/threonine protein kinase